MTIKDASIPSDIEYLYDLYNSYKDIKESDLDFRVTDLTVVINDQKKYEFFHKREVNLSDRIKWNVPFRCPENLRGLVPLFNRTAYATDSDYDQALKGLDSRLPAAHLTRESLQSAIKLLKEELEEYGKALQRYQVSYETDAIQDWHTGLLEDRQRDANRIRDLLSNENLWAFIGGYYQHFKEIYPYYGEMMIEDLLELGLDDVKNYEFYALFLYRRNRAGDSAVARHFLETADCSIIQTAHNSRVVSKLPSPAFSGTQLTSAINCPALTIIEEVGKQAYEQAIEQQFAEMEREGLYRKSGIRMGTPYPYWTKGCCAAITAAIGAEIARYWAEIVDCSDEEFKERLKAAAENFSNGADPQTYVRQVGQKLFFYRGNYASYGFSVFRDSLNFEEYRLLLYFLNQYSFVDSSIHRWIAKDSAANHPLFTSVWTGLIPNGPCELKILLDCKPITAGLGTLSPESVAVVDRLQQQLVASWKRTERNYNQGELYGDDAMLVRLMTPLEEEKKQTAKIKCFFESSKACFSPEKVLSSDERAEILYQKYLISRGERYRNQVNRNYFKPYLCSVEKIEPTGSILDDASRFLLLFEQEDGIFYMGIRCIGGSHAMLLTKRKNRVRLFDPNIGLIECNEESPFKTIEELLSTNYPSERPDDHELEFDRITFNAQSSLAIDEAGPGGDSFDVQLAMVKADVRAGKNNRAYKGIEELANAFPNSKHELAQFCLEAAFFANIRANSSDAQNLDGQTDYNHIEISYISKAAELGNFLAKALLEVIEGKGRAQPEEGMQLSTPMDCYLTAAAFLLSASKFVKCRSSTLCDYLEAALDGGLAVRVYWLCSTYSSSKFRGLRHKSYEKIFPKIESRLMSLFSLKILI